MASVQYFSGKLELCFSICLVKSVSKFKCPVFNIRAILVI